jgi:hypothetical protein
MKKVVLAVFMVYTTIILFGQEKKDLTISVGAGRFNSPYYTNNKTRTFFNFDFDYYISERHIISTNFLSGKHRYYDSLNSNNAVPLSTPGYEDNANATADYSTFSLLYKYKLLNNKKAALNLGTGIGIMRQTVAFPYTQGNITDIRQSSWADLVFPVRLEIDYKFSKFFQVGLLGGCFIHPDYPILGYHLGTRVSYVLK